MAGPTQTFTQRFKLVQGSGYYDTVSASNGSNTISDSADSGSPSENTAQLGDIANDQFTITNANSSSVTVTYFGRTPNGIVTQRGSNKYLYTNNNYGGGYPILDPLDSSFIRSDPSNNASKWTIACFVSGTSIRTDRGEVAVESLKAGDPVVTASGETRPIRWIGHRSLTCYGRTDLLPVRIAAHAFGEGRPARDLMVSPAHAVAVDVLGEVLIPACRLINGTTVTQAKVDEVTYWHVELDSHDLLLSEGLPSESYLECGNRHFFANADITDLTAPPDARPDGALPFCRPLHEAGPLVDLVRARLADRAEALGWRRVEDTFAGLHLVADGETIRPDVEGLTARFVLPAGARAVRLVSGASVPAHVLPGSTDGRRLGLPLAGLTIDDGLTGARSIALDDPRLGEGFYAFDAGVRWTDGAALLPASLWDGCRGATFLRLTLAAPALPRWVGPRAAAAQDEARRNA